MTKIVTVVTCLDSPYLAEESIKWLKENSTPELNTIVLLDNGSYTPLEKFDADILHRREKNEGANTILHDMIPFVESLGADIVAYFHCDMMVREKGWDQRVIEEFDKDPILALAGFVGSNEVDENGGRGGGTVLNFQGHTYEGYGPASPAHHHGEVLAGTRPVGVLDHCSLIFRIPLLKQLVPQRGHYAPGHFYDRIVCCQIIERGWHILYIGIKCDHFSGGTSTGMPNMVAFYREWLTEEGIVFDANVDMAVYKEAERRFFAEFKYKNRLIPFVIEKDFSVTRLA